MLGRIRQYWDWLWDSSAWCPRTDCGDWPLWLIRMHQWSDQAIWWAYVAIPCVLVFWLVKRRKLPYPIIAACFAVFIFACGYGHHLESTMFETPVYRATGFGKLVTAIVSWVTVLSLAYITPKALSLRTMKEFEEEIAEQIRALKQREGELTDFFDHAPIGLHRVGPDGFVKWVNQEELNMLGFEEHEYVGHHISEFHADQDVIADILIRLKAGEELRNLHVRLRCKDGSIKDVMLSSNVYEKDGEFGYTRCFTRDVTEIVAATYKVKESENKFRLIADNIPQLAWMTRPDGHIFWYNQRWYDYTGTSLEEVEGWNWSSVHDPSQLPRVLENWAKSLANGVPWEDTFPILSGGPCS
jgi:PAS domain S-box-containing protein